MSSKLESDVCCHLQVAPSDESYGGNHRPESNGILMPGLRRDSLHVTCGLTACTPGSAPGPMLGNEYGKLYLWCGCQLQSECGAYRASGSRHRVCLHVRRHEARSFRLSSDVPVTARSSCARGTSSFRRRSRDRSAEGRPTTRAAVCTQTNRTTDGIHHQPAGASDNRRRRKCRISAAAADTAVWSDDAASRCVPSSGNPAAATSTASAHSESAWAARHRYQSSQSSSRNASDLTRIWVRCWTA